MFRAARQNRIFQDVVDQIQEAILSGALTTGDRLPPERELKQAFAISRGPCAKPCVFWSKGVA